MALKDGDIIDERKKHGQSCGIAVKVLTGGGGFQKLVCCGNELGEGGVVKGILNSPGRVEGAIIKKGALISEKKNHPNSCGLSVRVLAGGAGFKEIQCCGNVLTEKDVV